MNFQSNIINTENKEEIEKDIYISTMKDVVILLNKLEDIEKNPYYCLKLSENELKTETIKNNEKLLKKEKKLKNKNFRKNVSRNTNKIQKQQFFDNKNEKKGFIENISEFNGKQFSEREYYANNRKTIDKFSKKSFNKTKQNRNEGVIKPLRKVRMNRN